MSRPEIRPLQESDWPQVHDLVREVAASGETYTMAPPADLEATRALWRAPYVVVAVEGDKVLGTAKAGPNRQAQGGHVGTASFMVDASARGLGVGRLLGEHVVGWHREQGYRAIQFNAVVSSNLLAVRLWRSLGFQVVGIVPGAFCRPSGEYADLLVMHLDLTAPATPPVPDDAEVRDRVLLVAARRFAELGWSHTHYADVAAECDLAVGAVERMFATKAELFVAALRRASFGHHPDLQSAFAELRLPEVEDLEERLDRVADFAARVIEPVAALAPALTEAALVDPAGNALRLGLNLRRMSVSHEIAQVLRRGEQTSPDAVSVIQMLTSGETFLTLHQMGWTPERYGAWLRHQLDLAVNGPELAGSPVARPRIAR